MRKVIAIAAIDSNSGLGINNQLLVHLPLDLANFKQLTLGQSVLMGRKTYTSIGRPLPKRENIIISRQTDLTSSGCHCFTDIEQGIAHCQTEKLFIIGGGEIYRYCLAHDLVDKLVITHIDHAFPAADAFFPEIDPDIWQVSNKQDYPTDAKHPYAFSIVTYERG